jgi:riboflavin synthase alpha subunit
MKGFVKIPSVEVRSNLSSVIFDGLSLSYGDVASVADTDLVKKLVEKSYLSYVNVKPVVNVQSDVLTDSDDIIFVEEEVV